MIIIKRLFKWLFWLTGLFILALVLFLTIPGIKCSWKYPKEGQPSIILFRGEMLVFDMRYVMLGDFDATLVFVDSKVPIPPTPGPQKQAEWKDGVFSYTGDHWGLKAGARPPGPPPVFPGMP